MVQRLPSESMQGLISTVGADTQPTWGAFDDG